MDHEHFQEHLKCYLNRELTEREQLVVEFLATGFQFAQPRLEMFIEEGGDALALGELVSLYALYEPALKNGFVMALDLNHNDYSELFNGIDTYYNQMLEYNEGQEQ